MNASKGSNPRPRVLVVEDDKSISMGLRINLEAEGYEVLLAEDGERAIEVVQNDAPDLVILDIMLPKVNGLEVLDRVRKSGHTMPIIILSARTGEMDKVTGLELGAEDYVAKPFSLAELLARVKVALRRNAPRVVARVITFADVQIDADARVVRRAGAPVEMTMTEFDLLMCLVGQAGHALARDVIFGKVWGPGHHGTPRTIDNFVQQLRTKLEIDPQNPKHILTVRGVGYRFEP